MRREFTVTIRNGPKVRHQRAATLEEALDALERRMQELATGPGSAPVDLRYRRFEPVQQVAARGEVSGPGGVRGGVDLRGDGSAEAFTGRLRRRLVEQSEGETPYAALRRALGADAGAGGPSTSAGP
jgi:hypothetical protein